MVSLDDQLMKLNKLEFFVGKVIQGIIFYKKNLVLNIMWCRFYDLILIIGVQNLLMPLSLPTAMFLNTLWVLRIQKSI